MSQSSSSVESLTRPRVAVAIVSAILAVSIGYYSYLAHHRAPSGASSTTVTSVPGSGLHRSNAVRRSRRLRGEDVASIASSDHHHADDHADADAEADADADADADAENHGLRHVQQSAGDGETVVEASADDWFNDQATLPPSQRAGHNIVNLLFRVSEDNARRNGCVHRGCQCNACGMVPIRGVRYRCANCADFDLCETCESQGVHIKSHIFYKIRVPAPLFGPRQMQPIWYTGDPDTCKRNLHKGLIAKLARETGFERPELEAFWEQWTFMANTEWRDDPDELCLAMDRKTFEKCLVPAGGSRHMSPNLIHDRMFSFYDSNKDDLISFSEFLHGLSYRKRKDKLRKVFDGYDIDGDEYVNRRDFLRMFRAYYVLYKQLHKDILYGLEDQLLASTETHQLVTSRQPLSSLFGREGRVPAAEDSLRFEGKAYRADGSIEIAPGYEHAVAADQQDTAHRGDILTSLFAYSDQNPRRQIRVGAENDLNWRSVRRLSGNEHDRAHWVTLLEPPSRLEDLPGVLMNNIEHETDTEEEEDEEEEEEEEEEEQEEDEGEDEEEEGEDGQDDGEDGEDEEPIQETEGQDGLVDGERRNSDPGHLTAEFIVGRALNESEMRESYISHIRNRTPKWEKRRRDMARKQLHERWKRRQFYLDEEEGGQAPDDWEDEEDILAHSLAAESSKAAHQRPLRRSRSDSKVKFAHDTDDLETRSNGSTSSRGFSERWGGMEIPNAERDAGKEILYQVTQQAFNELLDTIFKAAEDLATEAAETKAQRERYRDAIEALNASGEEKSNGSDDAQRSDATVQSPSEIKDQSLGELLARSGYTVISQDEPRNAVELDVAVDPLDDGLMEEAVAEETTQTAEHSEDEYRDPTLPQFRPNSDQMSHNALSSSTLSSSPSRMTSSVSVSGDKKEGDAGSATTSATSGSEPTIEMLRRWKELNAAEAEAARRGGWGRLSFEEFKDIYKKQEHQGNRLDYLGSWIDFCIP